MRRPPRDAVAGKVRVGCLLTLLLFGGGIYYGIDFLGVRLKAYRMQDEVNTQANFASAIDDGTIRRRLVARADSLGIPLGTREWEIRRSHEPKMIVIRGRYVDSVVVDLPGIHKVFYFTFTPQASKPW